MLSERPWEKEFDKLLRDMKAVWGGQITEIDNPGFRGSGLTEMYVYPIYDTTVDDFKVRLTISELPLPGMGLIEGADNVEYLSIQLSVTCAIEAAVRHEYFLDRLKKKLALDYEVQTGNRRFDRDYFLITRPKEDISLLKSTQVQEKIVDLEPFDGLLFGIGGINSTYEIAGKNPLNVGYVEQKIKKLIALGKLVQKK